MEDIVMTVSAANEFAPADITTDISPNGAGKAADAAAVAEEISNLASEVAGAVSEAQNAKQTADSTATALTSAERRLDESISSTKTALESQVSTVDGKVTANANAIEGLGNEIDELASDIEELPTKDDVDDAIASKVGTLDDDKTVVDLIAETNGAVGEKASMADVEGAIASVVGEVPEGSDVMKVLNDVKELAKAGAVDSPNTMSSFLEARTYIVEHTTPAVFRVEYNGGDVHAPDTSDGFHVYNCFAYGTQNRRTIIAVEAQTSVLSVQTYFDTTWKSWKSFATQQNIDDRVNGLSNSLGFRHIQGGYAAIRGDSSGNATFNYQTTMTSLPTSVVVSCSAPRYFTTVNRDTLGKITVNIRKTDGSASVGEDVLCYWIAIWN